MGRSASEARRGTGWCHLHQHAHVVWTHGRVRSRSMGDGEEARLGCGITSLKACAVAVTLHTHGEHYLSMSSSNEQRRPRQGNSSVPRRGPNGDPNRCRERSGEMRHSTISLESALAVVTLVWLFPVSSAIPAHDLHTLHEEGRRVPSTGGVELPVVAPVRIAGLFIASFAILARLQTTKPHRSGIISAASNARMRHWHGTRCRLLLRPRALPVQRNPRLVLPLWRASPGCSRRRPACGELWR